MVGVKEIFAPTSRGRCAVEEILRDCGLGSWTQVGMGSDGAWFRGFSDLGEAEIQKLESLKPLQVGLR